MINSQESHKSMIKKSQQTLKIKSELFFHVKIKQAGSWIDPIAHTHRPGISSSTKTSGFQVRLNL